LILRKRTKGEADRLQLMEAVATELGAIVEAGGVGQMVTTAPPPRRRFPYLFDAAGGGRGGDPHRDGGDGPGGDLHRDGGDEPRNDAQGDRASTGAP